MRGKLWVQRLIRGYIELFQGTPLLMQLFLAFFGVALFGIDVSPWTAAALALTLYTSAFLLDIWYGSIRALPKGQWEASRCLGLNFSQTLCRVGGAAGGAYCHRSHRGFRRTGNKGHRAGVDYRFRRAHQGWHHAHQRDVSAV